jgi:hypothetical protein
MIRRVLFSLAFLAAAAAPVAAQVPVLDVRLGVNVNQPIGDTGDLFGLGYGAYARVGAPVGPFKLMGAVTLNQFRGKEITPGVSVENSNFWSLQAGPHFGAGPLDIGVEAAWFGFEGDSEFGISPNVSIGLMGFEITGSFNTTFKDPATRWINVGAGFRF